MTPTEAATLARYVRAHFPHQPIDEFTADALHELLADYPAADGRQAVLNLADRGEHWCTPTAVKAEVKRIRTKRLDAHPPLVPPAGLTDTDERAWLFAARRRIGDGQTIAPTRELGTHNLGDLKAILPKPPPPTVEDESDHRARLEAARAELHNRPAIPLPDTADQERE